MRWGLQTRNSVHGYPAASSPRTNLCVMAKDASLAFTEAVSNSENTFDLAIRNDPTIDLQLAFKVGFAIS